VKESKIMQLETNRINRLLSFEDIVEKYGGPPQVWEQLRPYLPVWQHHEGQPIYLESEVDDFLRAVSRRWSAPAADTRPRTTTQHDGEHLTVNEAQQRYLGGKMSKEWWYRQVRTGKLPSQKAGGSVLLLPTDIEQFIAGMQAYDEDDPPASNAPTESSAAPDAQKPSAGRRRVANGAGSGFRFFGG
jgi:hypothetical protein